MKVRAAICDICLADGEIRLAAAQYTNDEGLRFHACATHLKAAKAAGCPVRQFDSPGDVDA